MNEKSELNNKLCCNICNKNYKSKSSLCNHNKKFHCKTVLTISNNNLTKSNNVLNKSSDNLNNLIKTYK